jgi:iron complex outermembrane receptor protein
MTIACAAVTGGAAAQTAPAPAAATPEAQSLPTVVVTANKVEQKLLDVPQAVTLITGDALQDKGIRNIGDLVREIPNLSSNFVYSNDITFRGINASTFTNTNPVVIYVDGVPQSNRFAYDALLENVERVEVLRGPQGSLYGKDAIGGVINIVTRVPGNKLAGSVGVELANQSGRQGSLSLNGPLINDQLFFTLSAKVAADDGWVHNDQPGANTHADRRNEQRLNLGLLYKPSADTQLRLGLSHDQQSNHGIPGGLVPTGQDYAAYTRDQAATAHFDLPVVTTTRADAQHLSLQQKLGSLRLDAVLTHRKVRVAGDYDLDWGNDPLYAGLTQFQYSTIDTTTQELRLSGGAAGQLRWIGGLYFEQDKYRNTRYGMQYPGEVMGEPFGPGIDIDMNDASTTRSRTQALFGQTMLPMGRDFELTLGARWQKVGKDFESDFVMQPVGSTGAPPAISLKASHSWRAFLPKAALSYTLSPTWKTYVSVARGYLPGGYNYWTSSAVEAENRFDAQTSTNYELGLRMKDGRDYLSVALFHMDIRDIHVYSFDSSTGQIFTSNAGKGHSTGLELEASTALNARLSLSGALGLVQAKYDEYGSAGANGHRIEKTPSYTASVGLQYHFDQGYYARADLRSQGKRYFNPENTQQDGAFTTVDLRAGLLTGGWDLYAYVRNLADTSYLASVSTQSNGALVTFGERRRFGVGARYSF